MRCKRRSGAYRRKNRRRKKRGVAAQRINFNSDSAEGKVMRIVKGIKEIELYTGEL